MWPRHSLTTPATSWRRLASPGRHNVSLRRTFPKLLAWSVRPVSRFPIVSALTPPCNACTRSRLSILRTDGIGFLRRSGRDAPVLGISLLGATRSARAERGNGRSGRGDAQVGDFSRPRMRQDNALLIRLHALGRAPLRNYFETSLSSTAVPPRLLLMSAASMKANISRISSGFTGDTRVWKNFTISTTSGR